MSCFPFLKVDISKGAFIFFKCNKCYQAPSMMDLCVFAMNCIWTSCKSLLMLVTRMHTIRKLQVHGDIVDFPQEYSMVYIVSTWMDCICYKGKPHQKIIVMNRGGSHHWTWIRGETQPQVNKSLSCSSCSSSQWASSLMNLIYCIFKLIPYGLP
jgi:hypothetical protein